MDYPQMFCSSELPYGHPGHFPPMSYYLPMHPFCQMSGAFEPPGMPIDYTSHMLFPPSLPQRSVAEPAPKTIIKIEETPDTKALQLETKDYDIPIS
jgi:hypothetical protein